MRSLVVGFLALGLVGAACAAPEPSEAEASQDPGVEAIYAYAGQYTFRIDARNKHYQTIRQGRASAWVSGNRARIQVQVDGYRDAEASVSLREGQTQYTVRVTMQDPSISVDVRDQDHGYVSAYSREDGFGVWADRYRFTSRIQDDGFTKFSAQDVEVRVNGGYVFGEQVRVYGSGSMREVEVTLRRRDLTSFSNRIRVYIPDDASFGEGRAPTPAARLRQRQAAFQALHVD